MTVDGRGRDRHERDRGRRGVVDGHGVVRGAGPDAGRQHAGVEGEQPLVVASQTPLTPPRVVRPLLGKPVGVPTKPVAGQRFTFSLPVTRSDTGALMRRARWSATRQWRARLIRHAESFKAGKARLSFVVPKTAQGKLLKIKIKITVLGQTASRTYTYAVR